MHRVRVVALLRVVLLRVAPLRVVRVVRLLVWWGPCRPVPVVWERLRAPW